MALDRAVSVAEPPGHIKVLFEVTLNVGERETEIVFTPALVQPDG